MKFKRILIPFVVLFIVAATLFCTLPAFAAGNVRGDMNESGQVDIDDAIYLLRHTLLPSRYPLTQAGDVNGDDIVNIDDAIYLLRHTLLPSRYPLASACEHESETDAMVTPTCTEIGLTEGSHCSLCGEVLVAREIVDALGHDEQSHAAKAATCTEIGWNAYSTCSRCDYTTYSEIAALGHAYENGVCTRCGVHQKPSEGLNFTLNSDKLSYSVTGIGTCTDTDIVIPSTYNDLPVTSIGSSAFYSCDSLTSVTMIGDSVTNIGDWAFSRCYKLKSVTIGDRVTSIGDHTFYNCDSLTSVTIPDSVTSIGISAFYSCNNLTSVTIGDSVTTIGNHAFADCTALTSIVIPNAVTSIESLAFYNCYKLIEVYNRSSLSITAGSSDYGYVGYYAENVYTPTSGSGKLVTQNGYIFYVDSSTEKYYLMGYTGSDTVLVLPDGINGHSYEIYSYAFYNCDHLTSVTIGDRVKSIGSCAFHSCDSLTSVTIGDSVTSIRNYAFYGCSNLTSVTIGNGVTSIDKRAFYYCLNLSNITVSETNPKHKSIDGNLYTKSGTELILYAIGKTATSFCIPNSVTSIGTYAFAYCDNLASVTIPDSVTSIGSDAFAYCNSLTSVTIGDSVTIIGEGVFYNCDSLTAVYITDLANWCGISFADYSANPLYFAGNLYLNGTLVTDLVIPDSVTSIGYQAFYSCDSLTSVTIPDSVTSIESLAFYNCYKLIEVYNRSSLSITAGSSDYGYVGYYAKNVYTPTSGSGKLVTQNGYIFYVDSSTEKYYLMGYTGSDTELVLPDGINGHSYEIYSYAFYNCDHLTSVTIVDSVKSIGSSAFYDCDSLTAVYITDLANWCGILFENSYANPLFYAEKLYLNGTLVTDLVIPDSVTSIGYYAFYNCDHLTSVTIPDSVTSIGSDAFSGCSNLTYTIYENAKYLGNNSNPYYALIATTSSSIASCTIHESTKVIADYAFSSCNNLTSIKIPDSVKGIGNLAFEDCESLTSVTIGKNVTSIGGCAFKDCTNLTSVTIGDSVTNIGDKAFYFCYKLIEVYNRSKVAITVGASGNGNIGYYAKNVYTPTSGASKLTPLNDYVFYVDEATGEYYLVGYVGGDTELVLPDSINGHSYDIYLDAFYNCDSLTSVTIPDSVTSIGRSAFYSCDNLTSVTIGKSVKRIGDVAFSNCYKLIEVYNRSSLNIDNSSGYGYVGYYANNVYTPTSGSGKLVTQNDYIFYVDSSTEKYYLMGYTGSDTELVLPDGINGHSYAIYSYAFYDCDNLTSVTIVDSVKSIGRFAFYSCDSLTSVTIGDSVTSIGHSAFDSCASLTSVTIGDCLTRIEARAFDNCDSLTSVTFRNTSGWWVSISLPATTSASINVSNPSAAAEYLTSTCCTYYWYRS